MFTQQELLQSLAVTAKPVKVFAFDSRDFISLPAAAALELARAGGYEGGGSCRRCRYIRQAAAVDRPHNWRVDEAAVLPPSADYLARQRTGGRVVA